MANENLKNALRQAGLTPEELADVIQVDPKSVGRWLAGTTVPYPRHRASIARALNLPEHDLWPDGPDSDPTAEIGRTASGSEVVASWAFADDPDATDPVALAAGGDGPIDLLENSLLPMSTRALAATLAERASPQFPVRILSDARLPLEPLLDQPHIEIRIPEDRIRISLLRVGDTMLATFELPYQGFDAAPLIELHRTEAGGMFDRLCDSFDTLWNETEEILTHAEQLHSHLSNSDYELDEDGEENPDADPNVDSNPVSSGSQTADPPHDPAAPSAPATQREPPRRWPGRPS